MSRKVCLRVFAACVISGLPAHPRGLVAALAGAFLIIHLLFRSWTAYELGHLRVSALAWILAGGLCLKIHFLATRPIKSSVFVVNL